MVKIYDLHDVTFQYGDVVALAKLTLSIERGSRVALLGANGSGKSTLLRVLSGLSYPVEGSVLFSGEPVDERRLRSPEFAQRFRRRAGVIFQNADAQLFNPTVHEEIAFGPLQLGIEAEAVRERVERAMATMNVAHLRDRSPYRLSGGEKKRVAIASVLVLDPEVLLLDEPTAALDPRSSSQVIELLAGWSGSGKTIVTATHALDIVDDIADRCVVLRDGTIAADDTPAAILANETLLNETNLIHMHRHVHADGSVHSHPHVHRHKH